MVKTVRDMDPQFGVYGEITMVDQMGVRRRR